jgi:signal-transduction protein with cAMP-binding, CBS, and nucleotidyltransferase domain
LARETNLVRGTFQTDPISALGLPPPVSIEASATVGAALKAVQEHGQGYVLVTENARPIGIMSEREVLMRIVARDVKYDANVREFMSSPARLLGVRDPIATAVGLMGDGSVENLPVVDDSGKAVGVLRTMDIIHFLAEAFPEQVLNLPPRPHQTMPRPEGG